MPILFPKEKEQTFADFLFRATLFYNISLNLPFEKKRKKTKNKTSDPEKLSNTPKRPQQRRGGIRNGKIRRLCSVTRPRFVQHASAPRNPAARSALLRKSEQVPLNHPGAWVRRRQFLLNSLGYATEGTKAGGIAFLLSSFAPSWVLNVWDVWVHSFQVHRAGAVAESSAAEAWSTIDFCSRQSDLCLTRRHGWVGGVSFHPHL